MRWTVIIQAVARLFHHLVLYFYSARLQAVQDHRVCTAIDWRQGGTRGDSKGRGVAIEYKRQELVLLRFPWKWRPINELAQARKGAPSHHVWLGFVVLFRMYMLLCVFFVIRISV